MSEMSYYEILIQQSYGKILPSFRRNLWDYNLAISACVSKAKLMRFFNKRDSDLTTILPSFADLLNSIPDFRE